MTSDPCDATCSNVILATSVCSTNAGCLCPTILASGLACSLCLEIVDADATDAAFIGSAYAECTGAGPTPTLTSDPCDVQCSNVAVGASVCSTNIACFCPTILASGLACSSCLATVDADATDAASIGSAYAYCQANPPSSSRAQQSSTVPLSSGTSAASSSPTASTFVQFKSGAHRFGEMHAAEMVMLLSIVAGLFTAFM